MKIPPFPDSKLSFRELYVLLLLLDPLMYSAGVLSLWILVSVKLFINLQQLYIKGVWEYVCMWDNSWILSDSQRYLCLSQRSKSSNTDKIMVQGGISNGLVEEGWFGNWPLKDKQVFGHRGSIFLRLHPLWSIFIVISFELLEHGKKWELESSKRHWEVLYICLPGDSDGKDSSCSAGGPGLIPHRQDPLEKGMATHSSILSWRIPWTEEPGGR